MFGHVVVLLRQLLLKVKMVRDLSLIRGDLLTYFNTYIPILKAGGGGGGWRYRFQKNHLGWLKILFLDI